MKRSEAIFALARLPLDAAAGSLALLLAYSLRQNNIDLIPRVQLLDTAASLPPLDVYLRTFVAFGVLAFLAIAAATGLYVLRSTRSAWNEMARIFVAALLWLVAVMAWYFLVRKQLFYSRILLMHSTVFLFCFVAVTRACVTLVQRRLLRMGIGVRHVLSVGKHTMVHAARQTLDRDRRYAYCGHVRGVADVLDFLQNRPIDLVLQTDPAPDSADTVALIDCCRSRHIGYAFLPPVLADVPHPLQVDRLGLVPMIRLQPTPLDGWGRIFKRMFDIVVAVVLLILLSPFMVFVSLWILLQDGWPVLYISRRIGQGGSCEVPVIKFRSMIRNADAHKESLRPHNHRNDGPLFKVKDDPRITRIGATLRRWSIDEWPQLLNVVMGQVSLVGPRPHLPDEVQRYDSYQRRVFAVKPGVTGLAQVSGRSDLSFDEEVALDLQYVEEWSLWLDMWILWRTIVVVLDRKGAD